MTPAAVATSVPGKVILMGEHSAVYGRSALVAALGRRATATLCCGGSQVELNLESLGYRERCSWMEIIDYCDRKRRAWKRFESSSQGVGFDEVKGDDPAHVVKVALGEVVSGLPDVEPPPLRLAVESQIPVGSGFGSSAAVAVAVVAALLRFLGRPTDTETIAGLVLEVERRQHGRPSGIDHAAALYGGVLMREGDARIAPVEVGEWVRKDLALFDTGAPGESTGEVVEAVRRRWSDEQGFSRLLAEMEQHVRSFAELLRLPRPETDAVCRVFGRFERCLERLGVVPTRVRETVRMLETLGAGAKVSGAGSLSGSAAGCLLVYRPPDVDAEVRRALSGCRPVEGPIGVEGLRFEEIR